MQVRTVFLLFIEDEAAKPSDLLTVHGYKNKLVGIRPSEPLLPQLSFFKRKFIVQIMLWQDMGVSAFAHHHMKIDDHFHIRD
jgi:hypothetical protein